MENVRSRCEIHLKGKYGGRYGAKKLFAQPNSNRVSIFSETLVAVHMNTTKIVMNKPIAVGVCILELSKVLMYDFHYNRMKPKYRDDLQLMYTGKKKKKTKPTIKYLTHNIHLSSFIQKTCACTTQSGFCMLDHCLSASCSALAAANCVLLGKSMSKHTHTHQLTMMKSIALIWIVHVRSLLHDDRTDWRLLL